LTIPSIGNKKFIIKPFDSNTLKKSQGFNALLRYSSYEKQTSSKEVLNRYAIIRMG